MPNGASATSPQSCATTRIPARDAMSSAASSTRGDGLPARRPRGKPRRRAPATTSWVPASGKSPAEATPANPPPSTDKQPMTAAISNVRPDPDKVLVDIVDYVHKYKVTSREAYETARYCLMDTLGCGFEAQQ